MTRRTGRRVGLVLAAMPLAGATAVGVAAAAPYPPPDQPTTSTSASEVTAGDPVTVCAEHYGSDVDVKMTDDGKKVTTLHTDSTGRGCVTVVWKSPNATAKPVHGSTAAGPGAGSADGMRAATGMQLVAFRAPSGTVCHTLTNDGPDAAGAPASTQAQVCVEPAQDETGSSSSGGQVSGDPGQGHRSNEGSRLPLTGVEIGAMALAALAAIGVGIAATAAGRRRRAPGR